MNVRERNFTKPTPVIGGDDALSTLIYWRDASFFALIKGPTVIVGALVFLAIPLLVVPEWAIKGAVVVLHLGAVISLVSLPFGWFRYRRFLKFQSKAARQFSELKGKEYLRLLIFINCLIILSTAALIIYFILVDP